MNGQTIEKVNILSEHIKKAEEYAKASLDYTFDRFKLTKEERYEKIFIGKVGEEIVKDLFRKNNISFKDDQTSAQELDSFDLIVGDKKIDVKTCSKEFHIRLFVVKNKFDTYKKHDYYVAVKIDLEKKKAVVCGYATKDDITNAKVENKGYKDNYSIFLKDLKPIYELIEMLNI